MKAAEYFNNGYSCSESILMEAIENGLVPKELLPVATSFSGGMGSGCLCGAIAGSQIILGWLYGKNNKNDSNSKPTLKSSYINLPLNTIPLIIKSTKKNRVLYIFSWIITNIIAIY